MNFVVTFINDSFRICSQHFGTHTAVVCNGSGAVMTDHGSNRYIIQVQITELFAVGSSENVSPCSQWVSMVIF